MHTIRQTAEIFFGNSNIALVADKVFSHLIVKI